jgi:peptidase M15-like protein
MNKWPRFAPNCRELTKSAHSANFTFQQINNPGPNAFPPDFDWALIKYPLIAPASTGIGLDKWLEEYGKPRTISSGYRDPVQNGDAGNSRHMLGDAVDFQSTTYSQKEFDDMNAAAIRAQADFIENHHEYCAASLHCAHADWRYHYKGNYQH